MPKKLIPFSEFVSSLKQTEVKEFSHDPETKVKSAGNFEEMRVYLADHYSGVTVPHSFMDEDGQIYDCVPIDQQPALKGTGIKAETPPDLPVAKAERDTKTTSPKTVELQAQLSPNRKDHLGNAMFCPKGTIPIRRVTLEEMSRFETLDHYFHKGPFLNQGGHPQQGKGKIEGSETIEGVAATHKYA
ncbi:MAG: DUF4409 domain-containing protein, partial [Sphingobacteriaceae bacterium]